METDRESDTAAKELTALETYRENGHIEIATLRHTTDDDLLELRMLLEADANLIADQLKACPTNKDRGWFHRASTAKSVRRWYNKMVQIEQGKRRSMRAGAKLKFLEIALQEILPKDMLKKVYDRLREIMG